MIFSRAPTSGTNLTDSRTIFYTPAEVGNNTHTPICTCKNHTAELMRKVGGERTIERRYVRCVGLFLFCSLC